MKKIIAFIAYISALLSLTYILFMVDEPTNKQLFMSIFDSLVIIQLTLQQKEEE